MNKLLTLKETLKVLNIKTYDTLRKMNLPIIKINGIQRIKQSDLENYINNHINTRRINHEN